MKVGDLVTPVIPPGHAGRRIRLYDIPVDIVEPPRNFRFQRVVTKLEEGECGVVTELDDLHACVLVRGILGWVKSSLLQAVS